MKKPIDFFCIGSPKSGTTWLFEMLKNHPQIFIPSQKEIHYFNELLPESQNIPNPNHNQDQKYLEQQFKHAKLEQFWGDFSTSYLYDVNCAKRLFEHNKNARIICIIRQPVERAYSHYLFLQQRGFIKSMTIPEAFKARPDILTKGLYYNQLSNYYAAFNKKNIKIILFDDLVSKPQSVLTNIQSFLQVETINNDALNKVVNPSRKVRHPKMGNILVDLTTRLNNFQVTQRKIVGVNRIMTRLTALNSARINADKSSILENLNALYLSYFTDDVSKLSILIERDLNHWISKNEIDV